MGGAVRDVDSDSTQNDVYLLYHAEGRTTAPMYILLLTILVLDGLFLGVVILLQAGKGGGLAAMGGGAAATEGILGGRQATTVLTRATWTSGILFMVLALVLSIMSSRAQQPQSILQQQTPATAPAPEPLLPGGGEATPVDPGAGGDAGGAATDPGTTGGDGSGGEAGGQGGGGAGAPES